jgi:hypothetical protein
MAAAVAPHLQGEAKDLEKNFLEAFSGQSVPSAKALEAVHKVFDAMLREIRQTLESSKKTGSSVARVILTGGGSRVWQLPAYLEEKLGIPCGVLELGQLEGIAKEVPERFSAAYGLALVACDRGKIALDFFPDRRRSAWEDPFTLGVLSLGILLAGAALAGKAWFRAVNLEDRVAVRKAKIQATLERIGLPLGGPLEPRLEKTRRLLGAFHSSERSPLKVLDAVSEAVPVQGGVRFEVLRLDRDRLRIDARADSFVPAEDFEAALREHPGFTEVRLENQKVGGHQVGGGSQFVITSALKSEIFR